MDTSSSRSAILDRIRRFNATAAPSSHLSRPEDYSAIQRSYQRSGTLTAESRLLLFEERLREYDAGVYRATESTVTSVVAQILVARHVHSIAIPEGLPLNWLPAGFSFTPADYLDAADLDRLDGVLSACTVAIALTGSLVLQNAIAQGPRRMSLVPDYHLCIVFADQVVETVSQAIDRLAPTSTRPTTFISGPSATADIEMTRVKGVHGPRFLDVVLIL